MKNLDWLAVRRFHLDGVILNDSYIWKLKNEYITLLGIQMRNTGYVPRLDIPTEFSIEYNKDNDSYKFNLAVYGVYVGERECEWIFAVDQEGPIPIPQSRLKKSSSAAA
jgi:hypothetical protein